jgi:hypothetical protein
MSTTLDLDQMAIEEKLHAMEELWSDLSRNQLEFQSLPWHESVLKEREERSREGLEKPIDWATGKKQIRERI